MEIGTGTWKLIALLIVFGGISLVYWKSDKTFSKMVQHTNSSSSAPFEQVILTQIMIDAERTQYLLMVLIGLVTIGILAL